MKIKASYIYCNILLHLYVVSHIFEHFPASPGRSVYVLKWAKILQLVLS